MDKQASYTATTTCCDPTFPSRIISLTASRASPATLYPHRTAACGTRIDRAAASLTL